MTRATALRIALFVLIIVLLAGVLYVAPKPAAVAQKEYTLVLKDDALASGPAIMAVNQGDTLTLHVQSNRGGHLMLHGYDKDLVVGADSEATLTFVADKSGRFFIHLHRGDDHIEIAAIEVQPR